MQKLTLNLPGHWRHMLHYYQCEIKAMITSRYSYQFTQILTSETCIPVTQFLEVSWRRKRKKCTTSNIVLRAVAANYTIIIMKAYDWVILVLDKRRQFLKRLEILRLLSLWLGCSWRLQLSQPEPKFYMYFQSSEVAILTRYTMPT